MEIQKRDYKVLLVDIAQSFGGAEVRVLTQARALQNLTAGCDVAVLEGGMLQARLANEKLPHIALKSGRGDVGMLFELRRLMTEGGYRVVDAHNVQSILWGMWAAKLAGVPRRVATIHSDFAAEYPGVKGTLYGNVLTATKPVVSHTINVTEVLQQQAEARGQGEISTLIPNAVPVPDAPLDKRRHDLAGEWGFAEDDFVVGIIGRLVPVKGHEYLIEAIARLEDTPHVKLVVVGTGALEGELKLLVQDFNLGGRVVFTGFRQDIPDVMQNIDCLCMASLSEALPYVILEAASYARPLVVTRVGGLKTLLTDGDTALTVPSQDTEALAGALQRLADDRDLAARLGQNVYAMVKERFSLQRMMSDVLGVYDG